MKISDRGVYIGGPYQTAMPGEGYTRFTDADGAHIIIDTDLLEQLHALWEFEKSRGKTLMGRLELRKT
jgi:hypothetical protein